VFAIGSLIGVWLIIGVLSGAGGALHAIKGASWGWVAVAFVLAQTSQVAEAWALLGAVVGQLPFGRCVALEVSNAFTSLVGGDVAVFAIRVRFFQRQGYDTEAAVSSGAIASTASWMVKSLLFLVALPFSAVTFDVLSGSGGHQTAVWIILATLITVNTLAAIIVGAVPVPGGAGVIEAGLIAGLTSAGIPQDQAVAAVLIQRLFTAYLPLVWGFATLTWMRRREYV
jgi:uncharacterized membrane protein YbhN (UPF0104 family)